MNMLSFLLPVSEGTELNRRAIGKTSLIGCDSEDLVTELTFPRCGFESLLSKGLLWLPSLFLGDRVLLMPFQTQAKAEAKHFGDGEQRPPLGQSPGSLDISTTS